MVVGQEWCRGRSCGHCWALFATCQPCARLWTLQGRRLTSRRGGRSWRLQRSIGIAALLSSLRLEGSLEHAHLSVQLFVGPLCVTALALVLCDFGLHLGAFNVPRISRSLVVVPFDLEEAHHTLSASANALMPVMAGSLPCKVYSAPCDPWCSLLAAAVAALLSMPPACWYAMTASLVLPLGNVLSLRPWGSFAVRDWWRLPLCKGARHRLLRGSSLMIPYATRHSSTLPPTTTTTSAKASPQIPPLPALPRFYFISLLQFNRLLNCSYHY